MQRCLRTPLPIALLAFGVFILLTALSPADVRAQGPGADAGGGAITFPGVVNEGLNSKGKQTLNMIINNAEGALGRLDGLYGLASAYVFDATNLDQARAEFASQFGGPWDQICDGVIDTIDTYLTAGIESWLDHPGYKDPVQSYVEGLRDEFRQAKALRNVIAHMANIRYGMSRFIQSKRVAEAVMDKIDSLLKIVADRVGPARLALQTGDWEDISNAMTSVEKTYNVAEVVERQYARVSDYIKDTYPQWETNVDNWKTAGLAALNENLGFDALTGLATTFGDTITVFNKLVAEFENATDNWMEVWEPLLDSSMAEKYDAFSNINGFDLAEFSDVPKAVHKLLEQKLMDD